MKAAYADPPYLGCGKKHYGALHAEAAEYDDPQAHRLLIERLCDEYDCWARRDSNSRPSAPKAAMQSL